MMTSKTRAQALAAAGAAAAVTALMTTGAMAQTNAVDGIQRYRQILQEGNPAELLVARGEALWKEQRGPNKVSLEKCDLGQGPGVTKGAYARMPRFFSDTGAVMDFESRLVYCMVSLQGFKREELLKDPYSHAGQRQNDLEALTAFGVDQSRGAAIDVPQQHPLERAAFERGKLLFYKRGGPYDFACATCHGVNGQRIRLQDLPTFDNKEQAQRAFATWPAYRVSQGAMRTMQWRLWDCFRQQRFPELIYTSQASVDLITYLGVRASGGKMDAPAIKR